jgi:hydroxyethylthiazole kinase
MHHPQAASRDGVTQAASDVLARLRARGPRVHCITNAVAQNFTANVLLAAGCVPSMTLSVEEIGPFVAGAQGLLVNLGTFDRERREATEIAVQTASQNKLPWVLDPVFVDRAPPRAAFARALIGNRPTVIRLNHAEFSTLAGNAPSRDALMTFARDKGMAVALSGKTDLVTDGKRIAAIANGHELMAKVTAMGCAGSALVAACLAVEADAFQAAVAALVIIGVAGELAAESRRAPAVLRSRLSVLHNLDGPTLIAHAGQLMGADLGLLPLSTPLLPVATLVDLTRRIAGSATLVQLRDKHSSRVSWWRSARCAVLGPMAFASHQRSCRRRARR